MIILDLMKNLGMQFGLIFGVILNLLANNHYVILNNYFMGIIIIATICGWLILCYDYFKQIFSNTKMTRLFFIGTSFISFAFALFDFITFYFYPYIQISGQAPNLFFGSVPFPSLLLSIVFGGFFSLLERILDLWETNLKDTITGNN